MSPQSFAVSFSFRTLNILDLQFSLDEHQLLWVHLQLLHVQVANILAGAVLRSFRRRHDGSRSEANPGRNSSKQNTSRKRYTDLQGSGGLYSKNFHDKRKVPDRTRVGKGRRGGQTIGRRGPRSGRAGLWWHALMRNFHSVSIS